MSYRVEKTVNGKTIYLRFGYWVLEKRRAQLFEDREAAEHARACKRQGGRICFYGVPRETDDACAA